MGLGGDGKSREAGREYSAFGEESRYTRLRVVLDEALEVISGLLSGESFTYSGDHYTIDDVTLHPKPIQQPCVPIWVGGNSKAALKRAAKYDGWAPTGPIPSVGDPGLSLKEMAEKIDEIKRFRGVTVRAVF